MKKADAEAIEIQGPQSGEKGGTVKSGRRGYTDQEPAEGGEARGCRGYTDQGSAEGGEGRQ